MMPDSIGAAARKPCPRCEALRIQDATAREAYLEAYAAALPEAQRAPSTVIAQRLAHCAGCGQLREGVCMLCGCYVQARTAKRRMGCPDARTPRWNACD